MGLYTGEFGIEGSVLFVSTMVTPWGSPSYLTSNLGKDMTLCECTQMIAI